jgi:uncharacterized RDD family membrane protein YckC
MHGHDPTDIVGRRVVALTLDAILVAGIGAALWLGLTEPSRRACDPKVVDITGDCRVFADGPSQALWFLGLALVWAIVSGVLPGITGSSPGRSVVGIRVIGADGGPPGLSRGLLRWAMYVVDAFPYVVPYLTGLATVLTDAQHRRMGDRVARTLVVDRRGSRSASAVAPPDRPRGALLEESDRLALIDGRPPDKEHL